MPEPIPEGAGVHLGPEAAPARAYPAAPEPRVEHPGLAERPESLVTAVGPEPPDVVAWLDAVEWEG